MIDSISRRHDSLIFDSVNKKRESWKIKMHECVEIIITRLSGSNFYGTCVSFEDVLTRIHIKCLDN